MNGPEHYRLAEQHLEQAAARAPRGPWTEYHLKVADLHAQLAQVAATVDAPILEDAADARAARDDLGWSEVLS